MPTKPTKIPTLGEISARDANKLAYPAGDNLWQLEDSELRNLIATIDAEIAETAEEPAEPAVLRASDLSPDQLSRLTSAQSQQVFIEMYKAILAEQVNKSS